MPLEVKSDAGTEHVREEVEKAVRAALGDRVAEGSWQLTLRKLPRRGFLVDLTNRNGIMRQWTFEELSEVAPVIRNDLQRSG